jgi:hypothetical protein
MATIIRRYAFELPGGPATTIVPEQTIVARPTIKGAEGFAIPVRVRRYVE